ncbi:MAG: CHAT domain-containing protein [Leptospirales bacterium]
MFIKIIVDRVGNTNVFNVIHDPGAGKPLFEENHSLQSITDDDLIQEYLSELREISNLSRSIMKMSGAGTPGGMFYEHLDLNTRLHEVGETFYRQLFPEALQTLFRESEGHYLFFQIDHKLASIPLEILSDGTNFLWQKFYIGKSVKGQHSSTFDGKAKDNLNMLIIADPTEDLEWARKEGENLYDYLSTNFPEKKLQIELISGRKITKLSLLNAIVGKDLIHYSGHLHYTNDLQENGWILYNNKIIHAREIQQSGAAPELIFSNSCISGRDLEMSDNPDSWYENFASSFLKTGRTNYIGSIWELPDNEQTLRFTLQFYDILFNGEPVGLALQNARQYARKSFTVNDITWASYLLMGNPMTRIFQPDALNTDLMRNVLNHQIVKEKYPFPISEAFEDFSIISRTENEADNTKKMDSLFLLFENTMLFLSSLVLSNYDFLHLVTPLSFYAKDVAGSVNSMYRALKTIQTLKAEPLIPNIIEALFIYKDDIYKIISWKEKYDKDEIPSESLDGYLISMQYLMERILIDIEFIINYGFYKVIQPGSVQLSLYGMRRFHNIREIVLPTQSGPKIREELTEKTANFIDKCVFYIPVKRVFLDLSPYFFLLENEDNMKKGEYDLVFQDYIVGDKKQKKKVEKKAGKGNILDDFGVNLKN